MTGNTQHILQRLFNAQSLEEVSLQQLTQLVEEHPSFNLGHYFLSKKLYTEQSGNFLKQTQKTALYFNNPLWLQWLLEEGGEQVIEQAAVQEEIIHNHPEVITQETIVHEQPVEQVVIPEEPVADEPLEITNPAIVDVNNEIPQPAIVEEPSYQDVTPPSPEQEAPVNNPVEPVKEEEPLVFQSYHTIDYFASQGIKFVPDENPTDLFGKQLKSFTEWLKTMKRLPQTPAPASQSDEISDIAIQNIAAHSIEEKEVVTEAMAEVLAKQGKHQKAIEIYNKLSLLNPDKSAYFVTKIDQLKDY